ncbi:hypothetical protein L1987_13613 [Smallanthus sonchifolius]|uniref:Uncharacterized protein n=1 Tax=Smallanthus sonchifolius TaxID=185202 RepID=A0ACB9JHF8_9ASTR|nr:hypothetical protein L1987_13613 [Smallanthus sonchifolius]
MVGLSVNQQAKQVVGDYLNCSERFSWKIISVFSHQCEGSKPIFLFIYILCRVFKQNIKLISYIQINFLSSFKLHSYYTIVF